MKQEIYLPEEYQRYEKRGRRAVRSWTCAAAAVLVGLLLTGSIVRGQQAEQMAQETQKDLAEEVFRFHVLANSDSEEDQAVKMKVKKSILTYMKKELPKAESAAETREWANEHLDEITEVAEETIAQEGYHYPVHAEVTACDFPDKTYGDITFPAGRYEALRVELGAAQGHNWWCVLYPNLCFMDAVHAVVPEEGKEELKAVLDEEEYEMVTMGSNFKIKWFFFGNRS